MEPLARLTPATIDVLRALSAAKGPTWGLQVVKTTERPSGSVYPILDRLEDIGWVSAEWEAEDTRQGARRRYYRLQDEARVAAAEAVAEFERRQMRKYASGVTRHRPGLAGA